MQEKKSEINELVEWNTRTHLSYYVMSKWTITVENVHRAPLYLKEKEKRDKNGKVLIFTMLNVTYDLSFFVFLFRLYKIIHAIVMCPNGYRRQNEKNKKKKKSNLFLSQLLLVL